MTDSEILELAAKAVGYEIHKGWQAEREALGHGDAGLWIRNGIACWNPLTSRADAFSLMVKLAMDVRFYRNHPDLLTVEAESFFYPDDRGTSANEAGKEGQAEQLTMRAITRCAAEVGRAMG